MKSEFSRSGNQELVIGDGSPEAAATFLDTTKVLLVTSLAYGYLGTRLPLQVLPSGWDLFILALLFISPLAGGLWLGSRGHRQSWRQYFAVGISGVISGVVAVIWRIAESGVLRGAPISAQGLVLLAAPFFLVVAGANLARLRG